MVPDVAGDTATLVFALYSDATSEIPLWQETQSVTVDAGGRYVVWLGSTRPRGVPVGLFADGAARWLGVRAGEGPELPRVLLASVPYAMKAADADTVGGAPVSAFVLAGERTGVGGDGRTYVNARALAAGLAAAPTGGGTMSGTPTALIICAVFPQRSGLFGSRRGLMVSER